MNKKQTSETPEGLIVLGKNGEIDVEKTRLLQMQDLERRQTAAAERVAEMTTRLASVIEDVGEILREQFDRIVEKLEPIAMMFGDDDDDAEDEEPQDFKEGELIVYQNGDTFQIGEIKRLCSDGAFVWYHEGDTASKTPFENMHKIQNEYVIMKTTLALDRQDCLTCRHYSECVERADADMKPNARTIRASNCDEYEEEKKRCGSCTNFMSCEELSDVSAWDDAASCDDYEEGDE